MANEILSGPCGFIMKKRAVRYGLVYQLRRKGFLVISRERVIMAEYLSDPLRVRQVWRLVKEYGFCVQFEMNY